MLTQMSRGKQVLYVMVVVGGGGGGKCFDAKNGKEMIKLNRFFLNNSPKKVFVKHKNCDSFC